jgi:hypothetical protein
MALAQGVSDEYQEIETALRLHLAFVILIGGSMTPRSPLAPAPGRCAGR